MPTLTLSKTYDDLALLDAVDLDNWLDDLETFLNVTKLTDTNIAAGGITASSSIANSTVPTAKLASSSITEAVLADGAITAAKITDANVTTAKIASSAVTTDKLGSSAVTTAKLDSSAVTTAKIADGAVTKALRESSNTATSSDCGSYALGMSAAISVTQVTNLSTTLTLVGNRPVFVGVLPSATDVTTASLIGMTKDMTAGVLAANTGIRFRFHRNGTLIQQSEWCMGMEFPEKAGTTNEIYEDVGVSDSTWAMQHCMGGLFCIDGFTTQSYPTAGSTTYTFHIDDCRIGVPTGPTYTEFTMNNFKLIAIEM